MFTEKSHFSGQKLQCSRCDTLILQIQYNCLIMQIFEAIRDHTFRQYEKSESDSVFRKLIRAIMDRLFTHLIPFYRSLQASPFIWEMPATPRIRGIAGISPIILHGIIRGLLSLVHADVVKEPAGKLAGNGCAGELDLSGCIRVVDCQGLFVKLAG